MGLRLDLQDLLETILGSEQVYFQPPSNVQMQYPAIVYQRDDIDTKFADNLPRVRTVRYQVTIIDRNPDSLIPLGVGALPMCVFSRHYTVNNLNHDVYILYF